jgi:hypothetical protein
VPVRRRWSVLSIIGAIVVLLVAAVVIYFAWVGWVDKGKPVPDVDVKSAAVTPARATPDLEFGLN